MKQTSSAKWASNHIIISTNAVIPILLLLVVQPQNHAATSPPTKRRAGRPFNSPLSLPSIYPHVYAFQSIVPIVQSINQSINQHSPSLPPSTNPFQTNHPFSIQHTSIPPPTHATVSAQSSPLTFHTSGQVGAAQPIAKPKPPWGPPDPKRDSRPF